MTEAPPAPTTSPSAPPAPATTTPDATPQFADFDSAFPDGLDSPEPAKPASTGGTQSPPSAGGAEKPSKPTTSTGTADAASAKTATKDGKDTSDTAPDAEPEPEGDEYNPPQVAKPSELRGWALRMGKKAKAESQRAQELEQRIRMLESQPPKQAEQAGNLAAELAEAKKRLEQYESDLRLTKYERSAEYKDKYQAPYQNAVQRAYREVKELLVFEPNPEDPDNPRERAATQQDFDEVYSLPLGAANRLAKQKFGDAAPIVMNHRQQIRQLAEQAYSAVEEYKGKAAQYETETKAQAAQREAALVRMFGSASEAHAKKNPEVFLPRDGDSEGNELLQKGKAFANAVFSGNDGLNPVQIVQRDSRAHNWLAAFPRLLRDVKTLRNQLSEANKAMEQMQSSSPGRPKPAAETPPKSSGTWEEAFNERIPE